MTATTAAKAPDLSLRTAMDFTYGVGKAMAPGVMRIVANNPSPYTFKGTNSYLIGTDDLILLDPGPDDPAHLAALLKATDGRPIRAIVLTHTHSDHVAGLGATLAATGARTAGFSLDASYSSVATCMTESIGRAGSERLVAFSPDQHLGHDAELSIGGWTLEALHTPGHAPDHLCLALRGPDGPTGILFSGDHVMGWNTSVVAPPEGVMRDYLASLGLLIARTGDTVYFPGHGGRIENPVRMARGYLVHRHMREQAIFEAIAQGARSIEAVVAIVYKGLDPRLTRAAGLSVAAHVVHLSQAGKVRFSLAPGLDPSQCSDLAAV